MANDKKNVVEIRKKIMGLVVAASILSTLSIGAMTNGLSFEGYGIDNFLVGFTLFRLAYYYHFYWLNMKAHLGSIEKYGEQYLKKLAEQLDERGLTRLVFARWFIEYSKEMAGSQSSMPDCDS